MYIHQSRENLRCWLILFGTKSNSVSSEWTWSNLKNHRKTEINIQNRLETQDWLNGVNTENFGTKSSKNITVYPQGAFLQFWLVQLQTGVVIAVANYRVAFFPTFWLLLTEHDGQSSYTNLCRMLSSKLRTIFRQINAAPTENISR